MNQHLLSITEKTWAPSTVMGWYSKLIADKYDSTGPNQKSRGRKPISDDLKALILRLADQNPSWAISVSGTMPFISDLKFPL